MLELDGNCGRGVDVRKFRDGLGHALQHVAAEFAFRDGLDLLAGNDDTLAQVLGPAANPGLPPIQ